MRPSSFLRIIRVAEPKRRSTLQAIVGEKSTQRAAQFVRYSSTSRKVPEFHYLEEDLAIYPQPDLELMKRAKSAGFQSMINLRFLHEDGAIPSEESLAKAAGLQYAHIPFNSSEPRIEDARKAVSKVAEMPKPIVVHCAGAKRAAVVALAHIAQRDKLSVAQTFDLMRKNNIDISIILQTLLKDLVATQPHNNKTTSN